jgi:hypothetical protein
LRSQGVVILLAGDFFVFKVSADVPEIYFGPCFSFVMVTAMILLVVAVKGDVVHLSQWGNYWRSCFA